ncbi:Tetraspanin/Peripherin [Cynara cardunculus var. scolymus]|uniref:Tetraspanin/Peripherin n=1 Tax=Cynara cardunculus var. scolymus TaxID=59895 RepID=A0A118K7F4_CYNCS|nr:Tetraspanin/Peripherin [Cynara cardunculus var. scolymus]
MAVSNNIIATINFIALICSIPIIFTGIWLASKPDNHCIRSLPWPIVFVGILFLLLAFTGFVGAHWNKPGLLSFYLFCNAALIVTGIILLILAFIVTHPSGAFSVPGREYDEYRYMGYSEWLRDHITDPENWGSIRACLASSSTCTKMPPTVCGYQYVNPITWINPTNPMGDVDCIIWNNDPNQLCYNCDSCKAGVLGNLRKEWKEANVILIIAVIALICLYLIAFNAYKNSQTGSKK